MYLYVVYKHPTDYPGKFVLRRWWNDKPEKKPMLVADTLEEARTKIPKWAIRLAKPENEDPVILETWI